jgi:hypothetical protein
VLLILMGPHTSILNYYWFSDDLILAYYCVIDSHVKYDQWRNELFFGNINSPSGYQYKSFTHILQKKCRALLMSYWFSWYLIPAYRCVIDYHVNSFQHTNVSLIHMSPYSSILMCHWFLCDLIPAYWSIVDSQVASF